MTELVVLVDESGEAIGTAPKATVHTAETSLHRAFSCYIFNDAGQLLVTQRALSKKVWPGVWTNSVCGHPLPDEPFETAILRRADFELGMAVKGIDCILPDYRYRTPPFKGIVENEICPVFAARSTGDLHPNPDEVEAWRWMSWDEYAKALGVHANDYSYWAKDQFGRLDKNEALRSYRL